MPITVSFDIRDTRNNTDDRRKINLAFERCGFEHIGGSTWRFPKLGEPDDQADFMNYGLLALDYFKTLVAARGIQVPKLIVQVHFEVAYNCQAAAPFLKGADLSLDLPEEYGPSQAKLSESRLKKYVVDAQSSISGR